MLYRKLIMPITDEELIKFNQLGLIPGPEENEEEFVNRAQYCLQLKSTMPTLLQKESIDDTFAQQMIENAGPVTHELFDIVPKWAPVIFSNHRLAFWHGGCAWIFQFSLDTPVSAFFQLRKAFLSSSRYLGIYERQELIAHESAHVGRMLFNEPKFEEVLAYRTAKSKFRQWFGPTMQSSWESLFFIFIVAISLSIDFLILFWNLQELYTTALGIKLLLLLIILFGFGRAGLRQRQLLHCFHNLQKLLGNTHKTNATIYRLQDEEIISFGKLSPEKIKEYVDKQATLSLRWRMIKLVYF